MELDQAITSTATMLDALRRYKRGRSEAIRGFAMLFTRAIAKDLGEWVLAEGQAPTAKRSRRASAKPSRVA